MFSVINKSQWDTICVSRISNLSNDPLILKKVPTILFVCYYCSAINLSIISNYSNLLKNNWGTNIVYVQVQKKKPHPHCSETRLYTQVNYSKYIFIGERKKALEEIIGYCSIHFSLYFTEVILVSFFHPWVWLNHRFAGSIFRN